MNPFLELLDLLAEMLGIIDGPVASYEAIRQAQGDVSIITEAFQQMPNNWIGRPVLLQLVINRIVVNPGRAKPFYLVNGKRMRFSPDLVDIVWRA